MTTPEFSPEYKNGQPIAIITTSVKKREDVLASQAYYDLQTRVLPKAIDLAESADAENTLRWKLDIIDVDGGFGPRE